MYQFYDNASDINNAECRDRDVTWATIRCSTVNPEYYAM